LAYAWRRHARKNLGKACPAELERSESEDGSRRNVRLDEKRAFGHVGFWRTVSTRSKPKGGPT
jgi:hypothetical protein